MSNKSERTLVAKYPMSEKVEETIGTLQALLANDDIKRLEMLPDDGLIRVIHYVKGDGPAEDVIGWDDALSSVPEMEEYFSPGAEGFQVIFDMMHLVMHRRIVPTQWVVGSEGVQLLEQWLDFEERGMPRGNGYLMGVPLLESKSLPQETLVLCGSKFVGAYPEEVAFAVKTVIDLRSDDHGRGNIEDSEVTYQGGDGTPERSESIGSVENTSPQLRIPRWGA